MQRGSWADYEKELTDEACQEPPLTGFYLVGRSWAYYCPVCGVKTEGVHRLRNGTVMQAFCCGVWKQKVFTYKDALLMKRENRSATFPVIDNFASVWERFADVVYEKAQLLGGLF